MGPGVLNGKRVAFASDRSGNWEIWTSESDGSNPVPLTSLGASDTGTPRWSPDGRQIAFDSRKEGHADIYVISAEGGSPQRLTAGPFENNLPAWSRDGRWLYFSSDRSGTWQMWKVPARGGAAVQFTRHGAFRGFEYLDGKSLYYWKEGVIWKMPVEGGQEVRILDNVPGGYWRLWGEGICFLNLNATPTELEFFDFASRRTKRISAIDTGPRVISGAAFDVSPDGKWLLYNRRDQMDSDIMLVENFR